MKIKTKAAGINRADVFYRQGKYPAFGLEVAGVAEDGRRIMAIINGGAFEAEVEVEDGSWLEIPEHMSFEDGAAIIEALYTCYYNFVILCGLKKGEKILIHGGASGIGVVGIQLAKLLGAEVTATAGKKEKLELIKKLGAKAIDYNAREFGKDEYDVILDMVGVDYWDLNLQALKQNGRMAIIAFISGAKGDVKLSPLLLKNLSVYGSTIRSLSKEQKTAIREGILPLVGKIQPIIDKTFPISQINKALDYVEKYQNVGKVVITA